MTYLYGGFSLTQYSWWGERGHVLLKYFKIIFYFVTNCYKGVNKLELQKDL
jgi:hypothetical protein